MKGTTKLLTVTAIIALLTACGSSIASTPVSAPESVDSVVSVVEESIEESVVEESVMEESLVEEELMVEDSTATMEQEQPEETPVPTTEPVGEPTVEPEPLTAATATPAPTAKATSTPTATPKPATTTTAPAATAKPTATATPVATSKPATTATPTATPKPATTTAPTPTPTPVHVHSWVTVAATGHYESVQTGTVHHDAVTHEEIEWRSVYQCNECLAIFYNSYDIDTHIIFGECGAGNSQWTEQVGSHTVVDQAAYDEPVYEEVWVEDTPAYEKCSGCGQTR